MKFKSVEKAHVAGSATSRVEFPEIEPLVDGETATTPWLEVRPAGEMNRAYTQASLRSPGSNRLLRGKLSADEIRADRAEAIPLYAEHVLTGAGGGWVDGETNQPVAMPLDPTQRLALLKQLPADLFDRIRRHCNDLGNFRG